MLSRVGHYADPAGFVPPEHASWDNRWDDPLREFRTLYSAENALTALVEVFQRYRPTVKAQQTRGALYPSPYLFPSEDLYPGREHLKALLGRKRWKWRVLAQVEADHDGRVLDLTGPDRGWLEREATDLLAKYEWDSADTHVLTQRNREFTQELARRMYEFGIAGVRDPSNVAGGACLALFEGRGALRLVGDPEPLTANGEEASQLARFELMLIENDDDDNTEELQKRDASCRRDRSSWNYRGRASRSWPRLGWRSRFERRRIAVTPRVTPPLPGTVVAAT